MKALILASGSPRRLELLTRIGLRFEVDPGEVDESVHPGEDPVHYVRRLAQAKAARVLDRHPHALVLGADTTVEVEGVILGKPDSPADAEAMLRRLVGRTHRVVTGFAVLGAQEHVVEHVATEVDLRVPTDDEIRGYVASGEWRGKAGGYAVQGMAAAFVSAVRGSITSVVGLPVSEVVAALERLGGPRPDYARGDAS